MSRQQFPGLTETPSVVYGSEPVGRRGARLAGRGCNFRSRLSIPNVGLRSKNPRLKIAKGATAPASESGRYNGSQGARTGKSKPAPLKPKGAAPSNTREGAQRSGGAAMPGRARGTREDARLVYCGWAVGSFPAGGGSSEGAEKASRGNGFRITMSTRRFLARPSRVVLEATG